jgi:hypothetical protein
VHPNLRRLFAASFPAAEVIAVGETPPRHDLRLPQLSIARLAGPGPETGLGDGGAYLYPPTSRPHGGSRTRPRVGLVWASNPLPWDRSCPLEQMLGLLQVAAVDFVSLQRNGGIDIARTGAQALIEDATPELADFADDAALVVGLDLVISVDTATAHLAGALGRPVWTLLSHATDWRYPAAGATTPWYPTMRLFRQTRPGDWDTAITAMRAALAEWAAAWRPGGASTPPVSSPRG